MWPVYTLLKVWEKEGFPFCCRVEQADDALNVNCGMDALDF